MTDIDTEIHELLDTLVEAEQHVMQITANCWECDDPPALVSEIGDVYRQIAQAKTSMVVRFVIKALPNHRGLISNAAMRAIDAAHAAWEVAHAGRYSTADIEEDNDE